MAILEGIQDGTIDAIACDHAPHESYVKKCEFAVAANGIVGLQTSLPLSLSLLAGGKVVPARLVALLSAGPARILGLRGKGTLAAGADADVTVIDPEAEWNSDRETCSRVEEQPLPRVEDARRAAATICGGRVRHTTIAGVTVDA